MVVRAQLQPCGSRSWTWVIRPGSRHLHHLNQLAGLHFFLLHQTRCKPRQLPSRLITEPKAPPVYWASVTSTPFVVKIPADDSRQKMSVTSRERWQSACLRQCEHSELLFTARWAGNGEPAKLGEGLMLIMYFCQPAATSHGSRASQDTVTNRGTNHSKHVSGGDTSDLNYHSSD